MAKGDGSITEETRRDGTSYNPKKWRVRVSAGKNPITGRYEVKTRIITGTKADARAERDRIRRELEGGLALDADKMTFGEFSRSWQERREEAAELAPGTLKRERGQIEVMSGYIGKLKLKEVTPQALDALYSRIRADRGITNATLRGYYQVMNSVMKQAVLYGLIMRNPCERVSPPRRGESCRGSLDRAEASTLLAKVEEAEREAYAADEAKEARRTARGDEGQRVRLYNTANIAYAVAARLGLATGARRGEILALTWERVDLKRGQILITESLDKTAGLKNPKTRAAVRCVSIDAGTVAALKRWKAYQAEALERLRMEQGGKTPVITDGKGGYTHPRNFSRWWRGFREAAGFPDLKFHELRHTQATMLLASNVDVKTVQARLGHANATVTLNFYAHAIPQNDREAARIMGDLLQSPEPAADGREGRIIRLERTA